VKLCVQAALIFDNDDDDEDDYEKPGAAGAAAAADAADDGDAADDDDNSNKSQVGLFNYQMSATFMCMTELYSTQHTIYNHH